MRLAILDGFTVTQNDLTWDSLSALPNLEVDIYERTSREQTIERCQHCEAVLTNKVVLDRATIEALPHLRYIGVLATGFNVVDTNAAHERDIMVTNIPSYSTPSVAQLVFAHLMNVTNNVSHYATENAQGRWARSRDFLWMDTPITELAGKTMAIRGLGNIGTQVAQIAQAFGMRVLAVTQRADLPKGVERVSWETALKEADVLSLHCPLTDETKEMINHTTLAQMKPSAILINTGRGPLVNEQDVADALNEGRLCAYCADVLSQEPPSETNPLLSAPRCYLTPHIAWASRESRQRLIQIAVDNLKAYVNGNPQNVVS